jgi:hypothetical protein
MQELLASIMLIRNMLYSKVAAADIFGHFLTRLLFIVATMQMISCRSASKIIFQTNGAEGRVRYYVSENPDYRKGEGKFYARVDTSNVQIFYSFRPDKIYKTYNNDGNSVYFLIFEREPMLPLNPIDRIVFTRADNLLDSLGNKDLQRARGATGFNVEVAGH